MNIKSVEYITTTELDGETIPRQPIFSIEFDDGSTSWVPLDPTNRHYQEIAEWYKQQETPPFEYNFEG